MWRKILLNKVCRSTQIFTAVSHDHPFLDWYIYRWFLLISILGAELGNLICFNTEKKSKVFTHCFRAAANPGLYLIPHASYGWSCQSFVSFVDYVTWFTLLAHSILYFFSYLFPKKLIPHSFLSFSFSVSFSAFTFSCCQVLLGETWSCRTRVNVNFWKKL